MIGNIRTAFTEILNDLDWMDDQTKVLAKEKVKYPKRVPLQQHTMVGSVRSHTYSANFQIHFDVPSFYGKVQVGNDYEKAQSERNSNSKTRAGEKQN